MTDTNKIILWLLIFILLFVGILWFARKGGIEERERCNKVNTEESFCQAYLSAQIGNRFFPECLMRRGVMVKVHGGYMFSTSIHHHRHEFVEFNC